MTESTLTTPITAPSTTLSAGQSASMSNASGIPTPAQADITLPADNKDHTTPSIWPLATGWWVVIVLLLTALGFATYKGYRYRQMKQQQTAMFKALTRLDKDLQHHQTSTEKSAAITQMNQLLRRLALMHFPRQQVASLTGQQWLAFLDKTGNTTAFSQGAGRILADAPYAAQLPDTFDQQGLVTAIKQWLTHIHRNYHQQRSYKACYNDYRGRKQ